MQLFENDGIVNILAKDFACNFVVAANTSLKMSNVAWKCPCDVIKDSEFFSFVQLTMEDVNEISREHFACGWHQLGRHLSFSKPGYCSYCSSGHGPKCVVYITNAEKGLYKCDVCLHLGASVLPDESRYEGSWGHQVRVLKNRKFEKSLKSPEPKDRSESAPPSAPWKRPRNDSYSITWTTIGGGSFPTL